MAAKKSAGNVALTYNAVALTNYMDQLSMDGVVNLIETTDFGDSSATTGIPGLATWKLSIGGPFDPAVNTALAPDVITPPTTLRTLVATIDTAVYTWTTNAFLTSYKVNPSAPSAGITWSAEIAGSGAPVLS